ncbi:MAG TPA: hypothetical protein VMD29_16415, partial [Terracidiphilus sp.]|nr:hypothetical protein [Terracidiphilus sp.]
MPSLAFRALLAVQLRGEVLMLAASSAHIKRRAYTFTFASGSENSPRISSVSQQMVNEEVATLGLSPSTFCVD